MNQVR